MDRSDTCILLVDDDVDLLALMSKSLEKQGFHVEARRTAPSAADLHRLHPAIVFMDVELGQENGAAVCHAMKHHGDGPRPVILMSGHAPDVLRTEAAMGQADGCLTKPFRLEQLRSWVAYYAPQA